MVGHDLPQQCPCGSSSLLRQWEVTVPEIPERPSPPTSVLQRARTWLEWVGLARIVTGAAVVIAVLVGAYWLVQPPPASSTAQLPLAAHRSSGATSSSSTSVAHVVESATSSPLTTVMVDVAGAVRHGGVYRLPGSARVVDAVHAAGGVVAGADTDAVNLAAHLVDGQRIYMPRVGEPVAASADTPTVTTTPGPVDINTAGVDELDRLPGVGPSTAAAIVAHREQYGPFASVDELASVRGIGPAKLDALRGLVTV
jgi:competence protein ComEA